MKKGFTLAELLITMGIIGVIAAILAPAIGNLMPDSNKGKVLKVYNALTKEDITHGLKIVGTGTIDFDGNAGEIDGVKYKLLGAVKNKADIFICPKENYEEAINLVNNRKLNIKVVGVSTLKEAREYLNNNY